METTLVDYIRSGSRVWVWKFSCPGFGFKVEGSGFRARAQGIGFGPVCGLGFRATVWC